MTPSYSSGVIMRIGVPREIKDQEFRVGLLPSAAYQLIRRGHTVVVERGAGGGAGYPDRDYEHAGARLVDMETGTLADACAGMRVPLVSVRAVSVNGNGNERDALAAASMHSDASCKS